LGRQYLIFAFLREANFFQGPLFAGINYRHWMTGELISKHTFMFLSDNKLVSLLDVSLHRSRQIIYERS